MRNYPIFVCNDLGQFEIVINQMNREDAIELANLLSDSQSQFLRRVGLEIESELMEVI